jgi:hypothetical protein
MMERLILLKSNFRIDLEVCEFQSSAFVRNVRSAIASRTTIDALRRMSPRIVSAAIEIRLHVRQTRLFFLALNPVVPFRRPSSNPLVFKRRLADLILRTVEDS